MQEGPAPPVLLPPRPQVSLLRAAGCRPSSNCAALQLFCHVQVDRSKIFFKALAPEGGASGELLADALACLCPACVVRGHPLCLFHCPACVVHAGAGPGDRPPTVCLPCAADVGQSVVNHAFTEHKVLFQ